MKNTLFILSILLVQFAWGSKGIPKNLESRCLDIHHQYLKEAYHLTKNCVGFSAPVSGRAYGYFAVGMYEGTVSLLPNLESLEGQLNGYQRNVQETAIASLNWTIVVNHLDYELLRYFYRNMPPSNEQRLQHVYDSIQKRAYKRTAKRIRTKSEAYAEQVARDIIQWSKKDGADAAFNDNYPSTYTPPVCASCWTKTFPGYLPALLPNWGANRRFLSESHLVTDSMDIFEFSTDSNSLMYQEALMVLENAKSNDPKYERIAEFWDDAAGYTGTPSGHYFSIASWVVNDQKLTLEQAMELYVKLGVAVNEAFISSFQLKYRFNFIRPITYIQRHIDPNFNTRLGSPPFPEYPSGHSFQSGAATEVMRSFFGDSLKIVDTANAWRTDIDGTPRTYYTIDELAEEISISRFYGGIHYRKTLENSLNYGRRLGRYVVNELKCRY